MSYELWKKIPSRAGQYPKKHNCPGLKEMQGPFLERPDKPDQESGPALINVGQSPSIPLLKRRDAAFWGGRRAQQVSRKRPPPGGFLIAWPLNVTIRRGGRAGVDKRKGQSRYGSARLFSNCQCYVTCGANRRCRGGQGQEAGGRSVREQ